ncbi:hypothetical protein [Sphingobacterium sp. DR205]|uniref:hypothetical protein n=1 Tax=Sphingobacterium sp. DR205 TaxID=2713573 RepID=UPI0013E4CFA5|nr:hypothetical protein [Sphingobacterium sp. DR205]QIH36774.1 hypothetical protein G6053_29710 [Sphingobacterium sp. DR205]
MGQGDDIVNVVELIEHLDRAANPISWSGTVLKSASSSHCYLFPETEVVREKLVLKKYHIELIQFHTMASFPFRFRIDTDRLFLLFALQGGIKFSTDEGY